MTVGLSSIEEGGGEYVCIRDHDFIQHREKLVQSLPGTTSEPRDPSRLRTNLAP